MSQAGFVSQSLASSFSRALVCCAISGVLISSAISSVSAQSSSPSLVIPNQSGTSGGGYATQAKPATQAGQAKQATQSKGYVSPYSPSNPYSPQINSQGPSTTNRTLSGTSSGGAIVDYNSSKGKTGTYQIPSNLVPPKTNPNSVLQGEVNVRSSTNPSLNESYQFQERATSGSSSPKSVTSSPTVPTTSKPSTTVIAPSRASSGTAVKTEIPTVSTSTSKTSTTSKPATTTKSTPSSTGNTLITVTPTTKTDSSTNSTSSTPSIETKTETANTGGNVEDSTTKSSTNQTETSSVKTETETPSVSSPSDSPTTSSAQSNYDRALKKAEKEQLQRAKMEGAATALQGSKGRAMGLLHNNNSMMAITSDTPRAQIDFNQISSLSASIGQFLKNGMSMAAVNPGLVAPEEEPLCAAPEISEELQKQLDEEKKRLKEVLRKKREALEKKLKKLKKDQEMDEDDPKRKKVKAAKDKLDKKGKKIAKKRQKMLEDRDADLEKKEQGEKDYDDARKEEYKARKGPPADPNCRGAACQKQKAKQAKARNSINEGKSGLRQFEKDWPKQQAAEKAHKQDQLAFEDALDQGAGQTKEQWKERMLRKQDTALRQEKQRMEQRIRDLKAKAEGGTAKAKQEKARLKALGRDIKSQRERLKELQKLDAKGLPEDHPLMKYVDDPNNPYSGQTKLEKMINDANEFVVEHDHLEGKVANQNKAGRGLNSAEARELNNLQGQNKKLGTFLDDKTKGPLHKANEIQKNLEAQNISTTDETYSSFGSSLDTKARDAKIKALESAVNDLKSAEDRVQNFVGQPDADTHKQLIADNDLAQKDLKKVQEKYNKYYDGLKPPYKDRRPEIKKAQAHLAEVNKKPKSSYQAKQEAQKEVDRLNASQARHDRQHNQLSRMADEKHGDELRAAQEKAELAGLKATGAKAQQIVSEYNRGLPDVFGPDGKVDAAKVNKVAASIDKQLEDVARVNGELGRLHNIRGNLQPGPNGGKSIAVQAGMSPKGAAKRLKGIDARIETAAGFRNDLQRGLKKQGFNSSVGAAGQCTVESVNSAMGAAYVKGARRAIERKAKEKKIRMAALSSGKGASASAPASAPSGTASPASKAVAKNTSNVQQVQQAQQAKQFQAKGGGQCAGAGGPAASCAGGQAPQRGKIMAGQMSKDFKKLAGAAIGGAAGAAVVASAPGAFNLEQFRRTGKQADLSAMTSRKQVLDGKIASHNKLLKTAPKGGYEAEILAQQRFGYITERDALDPKIAKLKSEFAAEEVKATKEAQMASTNAEDPEKEIQATSDDTASAVPSKKKQIPVKTATAVTNFENSIKNINANIEQVEEVMSAVQDANIPGLLPALEGQREGLFAGRAHLEGKLKELRTEVPDKTASKSAVTPASAPSRQELKEARANLETNIKALSETSKALAKNGNATVSAALDKQIEALEVSKTQIEKELKTPEVVASAPSLSQKELMVARAVIDENIKALTETTVALEKSGNIAVSTSLKGQIQALEASKKAIDEELKPTVTVASAPSKENSEPIKTANLPPTVRDEKVKEIVKVLDANIENVTAAETAFKNAGQPAVAQAFTNQRIALQAVREQYLPQIKAAPKGPKAPARVQTAAFDPKTQRPIAGKNPEEVELEHTKSLVDWINEGLLPAFKDDKLAKNVLPNLLVQLITEFGAKEAEAILDDVADYMEDHDIKPSGAIFIDELLKRINAENRGKKIAAQNLTADRIRTYFLREALQNKDKQLSKIQIELLQESLDEIKKRLVKQISGELKGLDNKPVELLDKLSILADLASLPSTDQGDLKPLLEQISRQLARLEKTGKIATDSKAEAAIAALKGTLTGLQKSLSATDTSAQRSAEISKLLERVNNQLAAAYSKQDEKNDAVGTSPKVAHARLDQARHAMRGGDFKKALDLIDRVNAKTGSVKLAKAIALVDTLNNYERVYAMLTPKMQQSVGKLEDILKRRDEAIADILEISTNPRLIAALLTGNAERLRQKGKYAEAIDAIDTALKKNPDDAVLVGTKFKLEILLLGKDLSANSIKELLDEVPVDQRLTSGMLALNNLISEGNSDAAKSLLEVLRGLKGIPAEKIKPLLIQLDYAEISLLAGKLGLDGDEKELVKKLGLFKARLKDDKDLDEIYKKALLKTTETLLDQLYKARKWAANYKSGNLPIDQLKQLVRDAMAAGRYDIAGPAMVRHVERMLKEQEASHIVPGFRQAARFLDSIRLRLAAGGLTKAQAKVFEEFLKKTGGAIEKKLADYLKERLETAGDQARRDAKNDKPHDNAHFRFELRQLAQLKLRFALLNTPVDKRAKKIEELRSAANQDVSKYKASILEDFDERGKLLKDNQHDKSRLVGAIGELNMYRAIRDGIDDYIYENGAVYSALGNTGLNPGYGSFEPKNRREQAVKGIHKELAGLNDNAPAGDIWFKRSRFGMTYGRGLREKVLSNHKNDPSDRDYENNKDKYKNFWLTLVLDDAKIAYKDARRAELINEDPTRSIPERAKLYEYFLKAEAKYLKKLVSSSNALLEMFEKLANTGRLMRGAANKLEGQIALNDHKQLLNEYQAAHLVEDAQRLFRALVPLRDASLAGEIKTFVNYLHKDWYEAGPGRAYNLVVGMDVTQAALEQITAESQKIQIALIRAGHNLPSQLTELDRKILRRHGFLRDGKYVIPDQIKLDPTKVGTEFVDLTEKGALATLDRFLNAKQGAELFATVALPGGLAGKFGRAVTMEMLALGGVRTLTGRALAYGTGLAVEAGAFTALNRGARIGLDPSLALQDGFWSRETLIKEYAHNLLIIGALKGFGKSSQVIAKRAKAFGSTAAKGASYARTVESLALLGEAKVLTDLNGMLEGNQITQDDFLGNLLTIIMLKGTNKVLEGGKKSASTKLQEARINKILSYMGKGPVPGTGPTTKVSQLRESQIKELEYGEWLRTVDKPTKILLEKYNGDWDAARKDFQKGNLSAADMKKLVLLRKDIVDSLANEIVKELGGEVQAFGSENLTSDYDISFVGPKAQLAVIIFNARFAGRWGKAARLGGRETGVVLDTNAYTETIQSLIKAGKGDTTFQDAFSHLAARKYLSNKAWAKHRKWILENTPTKERANVEKVLDFVESANREFKTEIDLKMAELSADKDNPIRESDLKITAENRLYEGALKEILGLRAKFEKATGVAKEALRQKLRNAQSRALYFAQEAYHTQAAIEHVVMTIQAAGRKITVESLISDTPPKLKVDLTTEQGRQSYFEQIANMMKEISHKGDPAKLASKGAKYFIRALDAAQIAGVKLAEYKDLIEQVVALDANRADLSKVHELLAKKLIAAAEAAKGVKLSAAERKALEDQAAKTFLENVQTLSNDLTAKLYDGKTLRVVDEGGVRRLEVKTEAMNAKDIINNIDKPTQVLLKKFKGNWDAARDAYRKGKLPATDMRLLVNLRRRIVDSLAAEIVKELGGEVQAFGSENLTSDYDISFVGPKAQLAVILFNARFTSGWGQASKIGGRETGVVLDTNAYTETIQSLIKAGKGDVTFQDAFAHLAGRKYLSPEAWSKHRQWILEKTPEANKADVKKVLDWVEVANKKYRADIEAKKLELMKDPEVKIREADLQITAENRLYEAALKDILVLREKFEAATGKEKEVLRLKIRNAQSKALYFAQEAYHTQGAIEHVVMSIQAAGRKITVESLLSDTPPKLKIDLTAEQGRQSYFEQIANMMKEISHEGDAAKLASKGAKYFVRALDAAQIAGLKLAGLKRVVELTVDLNNNRADLGKVSDILAKDALAAARKLKGKDLTVEEKAAIIEKSGRDYLEAIQKASNLLTGELYNGSKVKVVNVEGIPKLELQLPEPANDNKPFVSREQAEAQSLQGAVKLAGEKVSGFESGGETVATATKPTAKPKTIDHYANQREISVVTRDQQILTFILGEKLGKGATSYAYRHLGALKRAIRITKKGNWDAVQLDIFGRTVLETKVNTAFIRIVKQYKVFQIAHNGTRFFQTKQARTIEINELMEQGTAEDMMARQDGKLTDGQRQALDQGVRELNRKGYAWLDNKPDNYTFERVYEGKDIWRMVVIDPGGIVPMHGKSAYARYKNARDLQARINLHSEDVLDLLDTQKGARKFVMADIRRKINEHHKDKVNTGELKVAFGEIAYSPHGMLNLRKAQELFAQTPEAANENYAEFIKKELAAGN